MSSFQKCFTCFHWNVKWKSTKEWNWYLPATNTWNESIEIPEIWLDFTILQRVANKLFRDLLYIIKKPGMSSFQKFLTCFNWNVEWKSTKEWNWYLPATNTWNESIEIPEIWLDFTMLQGIANKLFRNESYMTRKFNILAFQNHFSHFHWNVERESRRL